MLGGKCEGRGWTEAFDDFEKAIMFPSTCRDSRRGSTGATTGKREGDIPRSMFIFFPQPTEPQ